MEGRIFFPGNPWPEGHPLEEFMWHGKLNPESGLMFDLHLRTEQYDAERQPDDAEEVESDFEAPGVWRNYGRCTLSSSHWDERGWVVGTEDAPFEMSSADELTYRVDTLDPLSFDPDDWEDRSFGIYMLGHDDVADHRIQFQRDGKSSEWSLDWRGKIALAYVGDYEFKYEFRVEATGVQFEGFRVPKSLSDEEARQAFLDCCADSESFEMVTSRDE